MDEIYDRHILKVLNDVGPQGISVRHLTKHVFNMSCTLFEKPDIKEVQKYVRLFVARNSRSSSSLIEHTGRWGCYRLNRKCPDSARQLMLNFNEEQEDEKTQASEPQDLSLNLFD